MAWDEATGKTGYFVITDTISHVDAEIVLLTLDGETLETTAEHPFYVVEASEWSNYLSLGRWVDAGDLRVGDDVLQADGSTGEVQSVRVVAQRQPMYNLTVDQAHTFFVGQGQWLVHNAGCSAKGLIGKDFENWLSSEFGGTGSFKSGTREFDGRIGNRWLEAKSGNFWTNNAALGSGFERFKSIAGEQLSIAKKNNAIFEVHSNTPIPQHVKDWLTEKGIAFYEHLE